MSPRPPSIPVGLFQIFSKIRGDIREWIFIAGVVDTIKGEKFIAGVNDTAEKLFTGVNDTADKLFGGVNDTGD